jgi:lysophospholipid acyltransferase (LPLAT)-like uncharacterized protein
MRWTLPQRLALLTAPPLAALVIAATCVTLRWEDVTEQGAAAEVPPVGGIFCFWHQCTFLAAWRFRKYGVHVLISQSFDGELIARTLKLLGYHTVRGSSARRGAVGGTFALRKVVEQGEAAIYTADGPRGPIFQAKLGPVKLAQATGAAIGSFHLEPAQGWTLRSWDQFRIPRPFTRVVVAWSRKVAAPGPHADAAAQQECRTAVTEALERARAAAHVALHPRRS